MKKAIKILLSLGLVLLITVSCFCIIFLLKIFSDKESLKFDFSKLYSPSTISSLKIYDNNGDKILINSSNYANINDLSKNTINAFVSIEDKDFYNHKGINLKRIIKAGINNLVSGSFKEGASTISQQLIKNTHLSSDKTIERKIKEIIITRQMEQELDKDEILENYLNLIYFGNNYYGIYAASKGYFDKEPENLTLSESAMLAGIIKAPSKFSPYSNLELAKARRDLVLDEMLEDGKISIDEYDIAVNSDIVLSKDENKDLNNKNDFIYEKEAISEAIQILGVEIHDLKDFKIFTYKDPKISASLEKSINSEKFYPENEYGNVASGLGIIINNKTGAVEALCGKSEYSLHLIDRQPGSAIKPILVYAPALENGIISPATQILDEEINIDGYIPHNVGGFHGKISVRDSIAKSLNIPAIKTIEKVGIEKAKSFAKSAGIKFDDKDTNFAISLGGFTKGINLKELSNSFLPFANNGEYIKSTFIKEIRNKDDIVIYKHNIEPKKIMGDDTAYLITDMLISGVEYGTSKKLNDLPYQVAGKTGTVAVSGSNKNNDAISIAYTSDKTIGVWLGNYSMEKEFELENSNNGGTYATGIIRETFKNIYNDHPPADFVVPDSVEKVKLDSLALEEGLILKANENTPERYLISELFSKRFSPKEISKNFEDYEIENLNILQENNSVQISFDCESYVEYLVCLNSNEEEVVLDRISNNKCNFNKKYNIEDYGTNITVYIKYKYDFDNNYNISHRTKIKNDQKYNEKINQKSNDFSLLWA